MSVQAMKYVIENSPYRATARTIHMCIADRVSTKNNNHYWETMPRLAERAGCSTRTAKRVVYQMVEDGYLERIGVSNGGRHRGSRYRFLMPTAGGSSTGVQPPTTPQTVPNGTVNRATCVTPTELKKRGWLKPPPPEEEKGSLEATPLSYAERSQVLAEIADACWEMEFNSPNYGQEEDNPGLPVMLLYTPGDRDRPHRLTSSHPASRKVLGEWFDRRGHLFDQEVVASLRNTLHELLPSEDE